MSCTPPQLPFLPVNYMQSADNIGVADLFSVALLAGALGVLQEGASTEVGKCGGIPPKTFPPSTYPT